ncbi:hypothetical protein PTKIN_Ptkin07bG0063800 [Pterospermum kingtungense]
MTTLRLSLSFLMFMVYMTVAMGKRQRHFGNQKIDTNWYDGRATFYGDMHGGETMHLDSRDYKSYVVVAEGACGYGDLFKQGYGLETTALSAALFNDGLACGACFEIKCVNDPQKCYPNAGSIIVTATNFCPHSIPPGGWCDFPQKHFDLSKPMFTKMAPYKAGVVNVKFRRISCSKKGGVQFQIKGNPYWTLVLMYNVGGAGDIKDAKIKGSSTGWIQMSHNWGVNWQTGVKLAGQSLSFQVTTSDGKMLRFDNVAPANWQFDQTFDGQKNF